MIQFKQNGYTIQNEELYHGFEFHGEKRAFLIDGSTHTSLSSSPKKPAAMTLKSKLRIGMILKCWLKRTSVQARYKEIDLYVLQTAGKG